MRCHKDLERHFQRGNNQNIPTNRKKDKEKDKFVSICRELAYVTNSGTSNKPGNTVSVIDTKIDKVIKTITVGNTPQGVAITPNGTRVFVVNSGDNTVSVINTATNKVIATILVGNEPILVAITPDGKRAYVGNGEEATQQSTVSVIDTSSNMVTNVIPVSFFPFGIAIGNTPFGTRAYVAITPAGIVSVIDANPNSPTYNTVITNIPVGVAPIEVAITPDGSTVYVTNAGDNTVSAIDTGTNLVTSILVGAGPAGVGIGNTPFGIRAFVTNSEDDTISVIDADPNSPTFNTVVDTIIKKVGDSPSDAAFTANGRKGYVPNNFDNTVSVVDTSTNKIIKTIKVGILPNIVAVGRVCRLDDDDDCFDDNSSYEEE